MEHYQRRIRSLIKEYNRLFPAPFYFERFLKNKTEALIADLGSGPVCTLGQLWGNVKIRIVASDINEPSYSKMLKKLDCTLITPIEYQDMERLTYKDNHFDLVHCVNAMDHTQNVERAISEAVRVCKFGGYVYLRHGHNQKTVNKGRGHYWDATLKGFTNGKKLITLDGFHTIDDGYFIISVMKKVK